MNCKRSIWKVQCHLSVDCLVVFEFIKISCGGAFLLKIWICFFYSSTDRTEKSWDLIRFRINTLALAVCTLNWKPNQIFIQSARKYWNFLKTIFSFFILYNFNLIFKSGSTEFSDPKIWNFSRWTVYFLYVNSKIIF